jgi:hypothetical protein
MFLWTTCVIALSLLQTAEPPGHQNDDIRPVEIKEVTPTSEDKLRRRVVKKDWNIIQTYTDVFEILSSKNSCSDFYGGPRAATTVLNELVAQVERRPLFREISFQMEGEIRFIRDDASGVLYRIFNKATVNTNGSFYQRRANPMRSVPPDVGSFVPGTRRARALILLHELAHLIEGDNGDWLIPDDGFNFAQSRANSLRIQGVCSAQLKTLK